VSAKGRSLAPSGTWATFKLAGELLALRVDDVQEVLMLQPLTPVPLAPAHIVGLLNLRGHIMTAVDLRRRLRFPAREGEAENLIVVRAQDRLLALVVDSIGDVIEVKGDEWQPPPDTLAPEHRPFTFGICMRERQLVLGVRTEAVVADAEERRAA
jgi:purine-binding chemotaxis protein CheW